MKTLRGIDTSPWLVGLLRGLAEAALLAVIGVITIWLSGSDVPDGLVPYIPILILALRTAEGMVDTIDETKQRVQR